MAKFQFFRLTDRQTTDGQNRLLNPASRMHARGNKCRANGLLDLTTKAENTPTTELHADRLWSGAQAASHSTFLTTYVTV